MEHTTQTSQELGQGNAFGLVSIAGFCAWFVVVFILARNGLFSTPSHYFLSWLQTAIIAPMATFWVAYFALRGFRSYINSLDLFFLTAVQTLRVLGLAILVMWGYGLLPGGFAIPMSILDASVGIIAVSVIYKMHYMKPGWKTSAIMLHIWGFLDFLVTITLALFAWKAFSIDPKTSADGYASLAGPPLSLFPAFAIPFFSCLHFAAWVRLASVLKQKEA